MPTDPYSAETIQVLPRVLALFDNDPTSNSYGYGDRYHWAWGLIDFGNGTFQGMAHGLARLWNSGLWPYPTGKEDFLKRIDAVFKGTRGLTRNDGSLEEAFPREGSFCVTALVAFDLLVAIDQLSDQVDSARKDNWLEIVSSLIGFVVRNDETHGFISNHLATAVAALIRWDKMSEGDQNALSKAELLLERILQNQSNEGWFREYEGADPGYQSLCTHYLADVHLHREDLNLLEPLRHSIRFLWHFAHPDGSFGGHYGSRSTRLYYPSGVLALADEIPEAHALSIFMARSITSQRVVSLSTMDESNLTPMFNSYSWAAGLFQDAGKDQFRRIENCVLPCFSNETYRKNFPQSGIMVDRGLDHYSVVNYKKGGVVQHYQNKKLNLIDGGLVVKAKCGKLGSSQHYDASTQIEIKGSIIKIRNQVAEMPKRVTKPLQFTLLRVLCLSFFRFSVVREFIKKVLVKSLITRPKLWPMLNDRRIELGRNLNVRDECKLPSGYAKFVELKNFVPIHMASKGYWQVQDEDSNE